MGFPRQVYWSGLPFPSPGDLPDPGMESRSPALQADSFLSESLEKHPNEALIKIKQECMQYNECKFRHKMYHLPLGAVTNYHKVSGLRQHTFITLQLWKP